MLTVVDTGICNLASVGQALQRIGAEYRISSQASDIESASAIILPGVGAFADGMAGLHQRKLVKSLQKTVADGVPLFGICLGMQLLAEQSEEYGIHEGLGIVQGRVIKLDPENTAYRVPNIGWCDVTPVKKSVLFGDFQSTECFYHVHSYHLLPEDPQMISGTVEFDNQNIVVAIENKNIFGVQFHPEKSQECGLMVLSSFVNYVNGKN